MFLVAKGIVGVPESSVRSKKRPLCVYKDPETSGSTVEKAGHKMHSVSGRHVNHGIGAPSSSGDCNGIADSAGFHHQCQEERVHTQTDIGISGFRDQLRANVNGPSYQNRNWRRSARRMKSERSVMMRQLARLLGLMVAAHPAVLPAPVYYHQLQSEKIRAVCCWGYNSQIQLSVAALVWWTCHLSQHNGSSL